MDQTDRLPCLDPRADCAEHPSSHDREVSRAQFPVFFCEKARVRRGGSRGASTQRPRRWHARSRKTPPTHSHTATLAARGPTSPAAVSPVRHETVSRTDRKNGNPQKSHHMQGATWAPEVNVRSCRPSSPKPGPQEPTSKKGSPGPTSGLDRMAGGLFHTRVWATPHDSDEPPNEDEPAACQPSLQPERD